MTFMKVAPSDAEKKKECLYLLKYAGNFRDFSLFSRNTFFNICCYMITYKELYFILQYVSTLHLSKAILNTSFIWEN